MLRDTIRAITPHQTKVNPERDIISCGIGTPVPVRTKKYCVAQIMIAKETFARQTTRDKRAKSSSVLSLNTPSWHVQFSSLRQQSNCLANKPEVCNLPLHFLTYMNLQNGCTSQCFLEILKKRLDLNRLQSDVNPLTALERLTCYVRSFLTNVTSLFSLSTFLKTYYVENLLKHPSELS